MALFGHMTQLPPLLSLRTCSFDAFASVCCSFLGAAVTCQQPPDFPGEMSSAAWSCTRLKRSSAHRPFRPPSSSSFPQRTSPFVFPWPILYVWAETVSGKSFAADRHILRHSRKHPHAPSMEVIVIVPRRLRHATQSALRSPNIAQTIVIRSSRMHLSDAGGAGWRQVICAFGTRAFTHRL